MRPRVATVITDVDNTLYDWVGMWGAAFGAMLRVLVERSGVKQPVLEAEARSIHRQYRTTEYAFLIQALPSLRERHPGEDLRQVYGDAIGAYRASRARSLRLFPSVAGTLAALKARGCLVVGYTDSRAFHAGYRARKLGLDGLLDCLYSPPDHDVPAPVELRAIRSQPSEAYRFRKTVHRILPEGEVKPNARVLADILEGVGASPERTIYIGDSLTKDVAMAQQAGITDVFARYGVPQGGEEVDLLRRVSHWSDAEIERERRMRAVPSVRPTHTLEERFSDVLDMFEFEPFAARGCAPDAP